MKNVFISRGSISPNDGVLLTCTILPIAGRFSSPINHKRTITVFTYQRSYRRKHLHTWEGRIQRTRARHDSGSCLSTSHQDPRWIAILRLALPRKPKDVHRPVAPARMNAGCLGGKVLHVHASEYSDWQDITRSARAKGSLGTIARAFGQC